jgi:DNA-binding transcriptional regulator/RsmH inhibitor MraZ
LRDRVGIDKDAVMIGASYRAEIWAKEKWEAFMSAEPDDADAMTSLAAYGI